MSKRDEHEVFSTTVAVLIACVTVVGAIVTWRAAVAASDAGSADTLGILAAVEKQDVTTRATTTVLGHLSAFLAYVRDDALADAYDDVAGTNPERTDLHNYASAFRLAADYAENAIPPAYLGRDQQLDRQRDLGEHIAQDSLSKDIEPQPHFTSADASRRKMLWLLLDVVALGVALILLTAADAIQNLIRYGLFVAGIGVFISGVLAAIAIEVMSGLG